MSFLLILGSCATAVDIVKGIGSVGKVNARLDSQEILLKGMQNSIALMQNTQEVLLQHSSRNQDNTSKLSDLDHKLNRMEREILLLTDEVKGRNIRKKKEISSL